MSGTLHNTHARGSLQVFLSIRGSVTRRHFHIAYCMKAEMQLCPGQMTAVARLSLRRKLRVVNQLVTADHVLAMQAAATTLRSQTYRQTQ